MSVRKVKDVSKEVVSFRWPLPANPRPPRIAYHLRVPQPMKWEQARDLQNDIIKAYQEYHHRPTHRKILPPTLITFRFTPIFTYGRRDMRPELLDRRMLEGLKEIDGHRPETRMAWGRDHGWFFFGPGQVQCWMVADLTHWHWNIEDVELMMNASLASVIAHYLPAKPSEVQNYNPRIEYRSIAQGPPKPDTPLFKELTHVELWKNNYGVVSHGCSLNVRKDQILWTNRLPRYGFEAPPTSSLDMEGWTISENTKVIESRIVSELCARIGLQPEAVQSEELSRILSTKIRKRGRSMSIPSLMIREGDPGRLLNQLRLAREGSSWARREVYVKWFPWEVRNRLTHPVFVKGWGQFIRKGMLPTQEVEVIRSDKRGENVQLTQRLKDVGWEIFEEEVEESTHRFSAAAVEDDRSRPLGDVLDPEAKTTREKEAPKIVEFTPPPEIIKETIQWSSTDFTFYPRVEHDILRRVTLSPSHISDIDFLDPPVITPERRRLLDLLETQKRVISTMRSKGESQCEARREGS